MTSRERVLNAINHKATDRMPIDLGMHTSTGISAFAYYNLRKYLGLDTDNILICDPIQFLPLVDLDVLEILGCDCVHAMAPWDATHRFNPRGDYTFTVPTSFMPERQADGEFVVKRGSNTLRMPTGGFFFDGGWPGFYDCGYEEEMRRLGENAEKLYKETDLFIGGGKFSGFFRENDPDWLCDLMLEPDEIRKSLELELAEQIKRFNIYLKYVKNYTQCLFITSDLGGQQAPLVNPAVYADVVAPVLKAFCDHVHQNSDYKVFMHSCGSIAAFLPTLIDCGIDIISPVQISAANMDPADLKARFGDKITFWGGGINTQNVLPHGSVEQVCDNVRHLKNIFSKNSGYVFSSVHNIMGDISPEKIEAVFKTAHEE